MTAKELARRIAFGALVYHNIDTEDHITDVMNSLAEGGTVGGLKDPFIVELMDEIEKIFPMSDTADYIPNKEVQEKLIEEMSLIRSKKE